MDGNMENELVNNDKRELPIEAQADCLCGIHCCGGHEDVGGFIQWTPVQMRLLAEGLAALSNPVDPRA
jgi:hypothetical protein